MERRIWKKSYQSFPSFSCPECLEGRLEVSKENEHYFMPRHLQAAYQEHGLYGDHTAGAFHAFMICHREQCGEVISIVGRYTKQFHFVGRNYNGEPKIDEDTEFTPTAISPAPPIISYSPQLADTPRSHLEKSFELFWVDLGSCANRLRIVVETLLDQFLVPRVKSRTDGSTYSLNLAQRIDELGAIKPGHTDVLQALREVGNVGSHEGDAGFEDILDCYELLEATLDELLEDKSAKHAAMAASIRARKGHPAP